jgi:hypothetical protein
MKKPFLYAFSAALYITIIVLIGDQTSKLLPKETILIPMGMLSLFVLSAAVMGFLFLSEPIQLYLDKQKKEAVVFFLKTVGIFACFVVIFLILNLIV